MTREQIKTILSNWNLSDFELFYKQYSAWLIKDKVALDCVFPVVKSSIMAVAVRCNETISFNDQLRNNDLLCLLQVADFDRGITTDFFDVTTDPCGRKSNIAHLCEQIYRGNIGFHRGDASRICIRSDFGAGTWINRTDENGEIIDLNTSEKFTSEPGHFGINIHNNNGFYNSSLGCIILSDETAYQRVFKPDLVNCTHGAMSNHSNIPVLVVNVDDFNDIRTVKVDDSTQISSN